MVRKNVDKRQWIQFLVKKNCGQKQYTQFLVQILRTRIVDSILGINIVENKCIKYLVQKMWTKIVDSILDINTVNKKTLHSILDTKIVDKTFRQKQYIQFLVHNLWTKSSGLYSWHIDYKQNSGFISCHENCLHQRLVKGLSYNVSWAEWKYMER